MRVYTILPILILLVLTARLSAQQTPYLSHYSWNPRLFNPASQGGATGGEIAMLYRNQFSELEAAIRPTSYLIHADVSALLPKRIGLAVQLLGDKAHIVNRFQLSGFFGYHLIQTERLRFSLGAMAGYLNQNLDFTDIRISDLQDLTLFDSRVNAARFDGGPGLAVEYRGSSGSFLALDAAATQLFSSDIPVKEGNGSTVAGAIYEVIPHLLVNARYRFQGAGFALEPGVIYRAMGGNRRMKAGVFDLNLNAYFLKNNRLMVGAGMRSDGGGILLHLGLSPSHNTRLNISAEWHASLGMSYEMGASYTFERKVPTPGLVQGPYREAKEIANNMNTQIGSLRTQQTAIGNIIQTNASRKNRLQRVSAADQCANLLTQNSQEIGRLRTTAGLIDAKRREAEKILRDAQAREELVPEEARADLAAIGELYRQATRQLDDLTADQRDLAQKCTALRPEISEIACLRDGDGDCLRQLFASRLELVSNKPVNLFPLQANATPGDAALIYRFPNDEESYGPAPGARNLVTYLTGLIAEMKQQGIELEAIELVTELQEDRGTIGYKPGLLYAGDLEGELPAYTLIDSKTGESSPQTLVAEPNAEVTLEQLGALKLAMLRQYLGLLGVPLSQIALTVRYNQPENTYREETEVVVKIKG